MAASSSLCALTFDIHHDTRKGWGEEDQFHGHFAVFFSISGKDLIFDFFYRRADVDLTPH
jgi:hypothetical protein